MLLTLYHVLPSDHKLFAKSIHSKYAALSKICIVTVKDITTL